MSNKFQDASDQGAAIAAAIQAQKIFQQAVSYHEKGQLAQAQPLYEQALRIQPSHFDSLQLLGYLAYQTNRYSMAIDLISKAVGINSTIAFPFCNLGLAFQALGQLDKALESYDRAVALNINYVEAHYSRANALRELKRAEEAVASYDRALALMPNLAEAHTNRGLALSQLERFDQALKSYEKAIALKPNMAEAHLNRGDALYFLKRMGEAISSYDKAIELRPNYAEAHHNRGNTLWNLKKLDGALAGYSKALVFKPDYEFLLGVFLFTKTMVCDWQGLQEGIEKCEAEVKALKKVTLPFPMLSLLDSPSIHKKAAQIYAHDKYPAKEGLNVFRKKESGERIRIGYYSAEFHDHATTFLMAELFESHNLSEFEVFGFSYGPNKTDGMRRRVSTAFEHFLEVGNKSDREVARYSRELGINIAIDLKGYTTDARMGVFAERCAPIQVSYLGYPGTVGHDCMDYIVADATVIPSEEQKNYTEKVVYLPHSYQVNDSKRTISERCFTRQELGLPEFGFVFCCFNNNYKILPSTFDIWMRILSSVESSVLWLFEDNIFVADNLRKEAESRGVDCSRLIFAKRMSPAEHLARHKLADLFLDTLPYNAHTTASDALWAGLPVLTCMGVSFASRVAASLLNAVEMLELITNTHAEYEAKAIELALNPEMLLGIKQKLDRNRLLTPLFNAKLFARDLESAYKAMFERYEAGLMPDVIKVRR